MDEEMIGMLIRETLETAGWQHIEDYIRQRISCAAGKLPHIDPFEKPHEVYKQQCVIREFAAMLNYINDYKK